MKRFILLTVLAISTLTGCTENQRTKGFGGKMTIDIPPGQKLVNVTWKGTKLWYLTRQSKAGETPESLTFTEKSNFGLLEGMITFKEQ